MKYRLISLVYMFISLLFITSSCSPKLNKESKITTTSVFYPEDKDSARIQYLTSFKTSLDIEEQRSKFQASIVGEQKIYSIAKPYGVTVKNGKIVVTDITAKGFTLIDLENKKFDQFIPDGRGSLKLPLNSYVTEEGKIYVADADIGKIKIFDSNQSYLGTVGGEETKKPTDVFVKNGKIWACDSQNNRINIYDEKTNKYLDYIPKVAPKSEGWLYTPTNICLSDTRVYISDLGASHITVLKHDGTFVRNIGSRGKNVGQFVRPKGISVDKEDNLYVVDGAFENVQVFNKEGQLLLYFGGAFTGLKSGGMMLPTSVHVDYDNLKYFEQYVDKSVDLLYLIFVANQFGPESITVYGRVEPKK